MTSNGPFTRFAWLRKAMYRAFPDDLRPSSLATVMGARGYGARARACRSCFLLAPLGAPPWLAMGLMLMLHLYITSNVPMGVPIEWNVMVVYGAFALFWAHPDVSLLADRSAAGRGVSRRDARRACRCSATCFPRASRSCWRCGTTPATGRGRCGCSSGESYRKLEALKKSSPSVLDQLGTMYDEKHDHGPARQGHGVSPDAPARPRAAAAGAQGASSASRTTRGATARWWRGWRSAGTSARATCTSEQLLRVAAAPVRLRSRRAALRVRRVAAARQRHAQLPHRRRRDRSPRARRAAGA